MGRVVEKSAVKLARLRELLAGHKSMLIVLQDNPDPDAIAAGAGLKVLANSLFGILCSIAHGGVVGRVENQTLAKYLAVNLRPIAELDLTIFDLVAMVDTQPATGNNSLPDGTLVDIVIDHHPMLRASRSAPFTDVRRDYGSTSTIIFEYLRQAGVEIDIPLATALLYGIRSDTQDLGRQATAADIRAHSELYLRANSRMLAQITFAPLPDEYYRLLHKALENAQHCGDGIFTSLGELENTDMIGEVADLLLRNESAHYALVWGTRAGHMYLSIRSDDPDADAGKIMGRLVAGRGAGGGHNMMAGGQIPLVEIKTQADRSRLEKTIIRRFMQNIGSSATRCQSLI